MILPTNVSKTVWPYLVAFFCIFILMGAYGWRTTLIDANTDPAWGTVIEQTINLVTGEEAIVVSQKFEEHWTLKVAKWGIKAVLAAAIFQSALMIFRRQIRQWRFQWVSGHTVFAGIGGHNPDLAINEAASGKRVAIICEEEHHPREGELEEKGVLLLTGSPADVRKLKAAGAHRAARVVVNAAAGDDASIEAAESVDALTAGSHNAANPEVLVCIDSRETRELLNTRWKLIAQPRRIQTRTVGFEAAALRRVVTSMAEELAARPETMSRGPKILVAADREFTLEFLRAAIPFIQISGSALPEYTIAADDHEEAKLFERLFPCAALVTNVRFLIEDDRLVATCTELEGSEFDLAVVRMPSESSTMQLAQRILASPLLKVHRVHALLVHSPRTQFVQTENLKVLSTFEEGLKSPEFGDLELENQARANHEAYLAGLKPEERAKATDYDALVFKESNRWAVLHRQIKKTIWNATPESLRPPLIEHLTICEHQRWMGEKVMEGWRGGSPRDNARKVHPDISSFAELSEEVKEKDRVQVRKGLGLFNQ
jgi:hypothetical protein